jgi:hypothetical protein
MFPQSYDRRKLIDRLENNRKIVATAYKTPCWEWTRSRKDSGYGEIRLGSRLYRVHRVAAHLWLDLDIERSDILVLHDCDNPPCFNPEHLKIGTYFDNNQEMTNKGRHVSGYGLLDNRGENHGMAKLTEEMVRDILVRLSRDEKQIAIARLYGVSDGLINMIAKRKRWSHITI